jgi:transcriptional regulator with XRE-family HTH domain
MSAQVGPSFGTALREALEARRITQADLARQLNYGAAQVSRWVNERSLPNKQSLRRIEMILMIDLSDSYERSRQATLPRDNQNLLFRVYIPAKRLYAAEANRLLSLFREWFIATRGQGVRQTGYRTASGEMYEFFADASITHTDIRQEFDSFSDFLTLCSENPQAAADMLAPTGIDRVSSTDLINYFGREVRRLQIDLRHERERRMLAIRQNLEDQLLENRVDLRSIPVNQLNAMVDRLVPGPSAPESLALLAVPWDRQRSAPITLNISPQIITAAESTIIQNVQGIVHLGTQAKELLALIDRYGGQETAVLESAIHELEDPAAPPANRWAAKRLLKKFLAQISETVHDVAIDLLEKYLESKLGM